MSVWIVVPPQVVPDFQIPHQLDAGLIFYAPDFGEQQPCYLLMALIIGVDGIIKQADIR